MVQIENYEFAQEQLNQRIATLSATIADLQDRLATASGQELVDRSIVTEMNANWEAR
jgi:prefoldin subunit 5